MEFKIDTLREGKLYVQFVLFPAGKWESHISLKTSQLSRSKMTWNTKTFCENILTTGRHGGFCQIPGRFLEILTSQTQSRGLGPSLQPAPESDVLMFPQRRRSLEVLRPNRHVWTDGLSWVSPSNLRVRQFEYLMFPCNFWNRLRGPGSHEKPFQEDKFFITLENFKDYYFILDEMQGLGF